MYYYVEEKHDELLNCYIHSLHSTFARDFVVTENALAEFAVKSTTGKWYYNLYFFFSRYVCYLVFA
jgi:hypothetical protein